MSDDAQETSGREVVAGLFGDLTELAAEAAETSCSEVEPVHVLAGLVRQGGSVLRTEVFTRHRADPDLFCQFLYTAALDEGRPPGMPTTTGPEILSEATRDVLRDLGRHRAARTTPTDDESLLVRTLLDHVPQARPLLAAVLGSDEAFTDFVSGLERPPSDPQDARPVFDDDTGELVEDAFGGSGRRVLTVLREETAALGHRRVNALHLLYVLIGIDGGVLEGAVRSQGIDPRHDLHGKLSSVLRRPGARREAVPRLDKDTLHGSVRLALQRAVADSARRGSPAGEHDITRAIVAQDGGVAAGWLADHGVDLERLRTDLAVWDTADEEPTQDALVPLAEIGDRLRGRVLGQDEAIERVLPWVKRLRYGFPRERGPAGVFMFLGPSGCGKTELAKALAETVYGSDEHLIMLEMGQFATRESVNRFVGASPGYVGYGQGKLTNGLRDKPRSVVLFDEIEKAHTDVWPALLRFLDEGLIDDPAGPVRDGRGCIVVLTSNLGSGPDGGTGAGVNGAGLRDTVLGHFGRPEFGNRMDETVRLRPLDAETYGRLVRRQLESDRAGFAERGVRVEVADDVREVLTREAAASAEGARAVSRLTTRFVVSPVIDLLVGDGAGPGGSHVVVGLDGGTIRAEVR